MTASTPTPTGKPDPSSLSDRQRRILEVIRDAVVTIEVFSIGRRDTIYRA